jgi:hypothetical protein
MFDASLWLHLGSLYETRRILAEAFSRTRRQRRNSNGKGGTEHDNLQVGVADSLAKN